MSKEILFTQPAAEPKSPKLACVDFYSDDLASFGNVAVYPDGRIRTSFADYYPAVEFAPGENADAAVEAGLADVNDLGVLTVLTKNAIAEARRAFREGKTAEDTVVL